jgi:hypothetical protein
MLLYLPFIHNSKFNTNHKDNKTNQTAIPTARNRSTPHFHYY